MKVLLIKMTSMGDIIHSFPALTDAGIAINNLSIDWVVEESFQHLPKWHPLVDKVIPVAFRRWRKSPIKTLLNNEILKQLKNLRSKKYDLVIDAQGLLKSSIVTALTKGKTISYDRKSAKENWANFLYQNKVRVNRKQHAVSRVRELFAKALNYPVPSDTPDYGLDWKRFTENFNKDYLVFLPNTTWDTKHWPESYWQQLVKTATDANWNIYLPWGTPKEKQRAEQFAQISDKVRVLPKMGLTQVAGIIAGSKAVVALDTGLAHLAAAFAIPTISLYGPTNPALTGTMGANQIHMAADFSCAPCLSKKCHYKSSSQVQPACFESIAPKHVWTKLSPLLKSNESE